MVSALFFVYGCSDISDSPPHSYVSDDNIQTVDFIYDINSLYVSYSVILNNIDETNLIYGILVITALLLLNLIHIITAKKVYIQLFLKLFWIMTVN